MNELKTFEEVCARLTYDLGLVENIDQTYSPLQRYIFSETKRQIADVDALYFSGDIPVIYFKRLSEFDEEFVKELHRRIWNQNRIPLLYVITPGELRIYNCFEDPAKPGSEHNLDTEERLIKHFNLAAKILEDFDEFSKPQIDSGIFWKSKIGQHFRSDRRVDQRLLEELQTTRENLYNQGLNYHYIHNLLGRSIFILYLEDRGAIKSEYYNRFLSGARSYVDILGDIDATYSLFEHLEKKFNGDLFPLQDERQVIKSQHLEQIRELFSGTYMLTGQRVLWRPYDFGVIPIEFVSAIYEKFLHKEEGKDYTSETGAYYTPHPLVEFILNEVLPWPSERDCRYDLLILDPACGSGIFLVEAFRRLIARWMFSHNATEIPPERLKEILSKYIYGIDINLDAIRVAAFSLYLALLDYLEPKTIWEEFQFPNLVYDTNDLKSNGKNLFPMDTFSVEDSGKPPFENSDYNIVVGNPPWKRDDLPKNISEYCSSRGFAQEKAQAFLWRARDFSSNGKIALVATSKILFNSEANDSRFRREFFRNNYVETIINFSALRRKTGTIGRQLFTSSIGPAAVFIYSVTASAQPKPTILYCNPKPTRANNALPVITIDSSEISFLSREKCIESDVIWKVAMWGTQRDLEIIEKFLDNNPLSNFINEDKGWFWARGLQRPDITGPHENEEISELSLMPTNFIKRYLLDKKQLKKIEKKYFFRTGDINTYYAPHVLLKRGPSKNRLCAVFADFDCAFTDSVFGIAAKNQELNLKALTAYFNSSFASYFTFLTASMWGIERDRITKSELLQHPDVLFQMPNSDVKSLAKKVEDLQELLFSGIPETDVRVSKLEGEIDNIIYEALNLSNIDRILIEDNLKYSLDFFWKGEKSNACNPVHIREITTYAETFCHTVNSILQFGQLRAWATVYTGASSPLRLVSIHFNRLNEAGTIDKQVSSDKLLEALTNLEKKIQTEYSESLYVRRNIKFYDGDTLHITKPDEKRFWSRSMALHDADETLAEGLHGAK